jgi:hypothetical protein
VSRDDAASIFCLMVSLVSASVVVSHTEPHQAPAAPIDIAAAICVPVVMPPAARMGVVAPIA